MRDLPDRWADEPWPLDDPVPAPSFRPSNWSDTHDQPPQVADLADEAWEYAVDNGVSMERALVDLQDQKLHGSQTFATGGVIGKGTVKVYFVPGIGAGVAPTEAEVEQGVDLTEFIQWGDDSTGKPWIVDDP